MLVVETIAKTRRAYSRQGKAIKAFCRELGVSRKVVRDPLLIIGMSLGPMACQRWARSCPCHLPPCRSPMYQ